MSVGRGGAWNSTLGGLSIAHAATSVLAAPLRTSTLVGPLLLRSLTNPLATLLADVPSLDVLADSAARASGQPEAAGTRVSTPARTPRPSTSPSSRGGPSAPSGQRPTTTQEVPGGSPARPAATTVGPRAPRPSSSPSPASGAGPEPGTASTPTPPPPPSAAPLATTAPRAGHGGTPTPHSGVAVPDLAALLERVSSSALAAAARLDGRRSAETAVHRGSPSPTPASSQVPSPDSRSDERAGAGSGPATTGHLPGLPDVGGPMLVGAGALGELVGRWQQPAALPDLTGSGAARFPSLTRTTSMGGMTADRGPGGAGAEVSLDQVQLALAELLRREAEQHGLDGDPR